MRCYLASCWCLVFRWCVHSWCVVPLSLRLTHHKPEPVKLWTEMDREEKMWRYYLWSLSHYCHTLPSWSVVTTPVTCSELWCWKPAEGMSRALSLKQIKSIFYLLFLNFPISPALLLTVQGMLTVWLQDSDWRPSVGEQDWVWWWVWSLSTDTGVRVHRVTHRQSHRHWSSSLSSQESRVQRSSFRPYYCPSERNLTFDCVQTLVVTVFPSFSSKPVSVVSRSPSLKRILAINFLTIIWFVLRLVTLKLWFLWLQSYKVMTLLILLNSVL